VSATDAIISRVQGFPRAIQWLLLAAVGLVLFLTWDGVIRPLTEDFDSTSSRIEAQLNEIREGRNVTKDLRASAMKNAVVSLGEVAKPEAIDVVSANLNTLVNETLKKHAATNPNFSARTRGKLPNNALTSVRQGGRIDRYTVDLKFDATPQAAAAIIADIESSPAVHSVNSIRMVRDTGGKVKVAIAFEAWTLEAKSKGGAA